ncbi:MAG: nonstructural protein [Microviridae sp.]|nr:MAG: nonstructural protein [Microviridae sp.]
MIYPIVSIRDVKTGFLVPTWDANLEAASRGFLMAVSKSPDLMSFVPADFALYHVADFDTDSGVMHPVNPPVHIVDASAAFKVGGSDGR